MYSSNHLSPSKERDDRVRVVCNLKQISVDIVKKHIKDLSLKTQTTIQPVFVSRKIDRDLNLKESKISIVDQQCVG